MDTAGHYIGTKYNEKIRSYWTRINVDFFFLLA